MRPPGVSRTGPSLCAAEDDPKLREFLEVMQPRVKGALWSNDAGAVKPAAAVALAGQAGGVATKRKRKQDAVEDAADAGPEDEEDDALYQELPVKAAKGADSGKQTSSLFCLQPKASEREAQLHN